MTDDDINNLYGERLYKAELDDLSFLKDTLDCETSL